MKYFKTEQINMVCFFYPFMPFLRKQGETIQFCKKRIKVRMCAEKKSFISSPSVAVQCKFVPRYLKRPLLQQSIRLKGNCVGICLAFYNLKEVLQTEKYIQSAAYMNVEATK